MERTTKRKPIVWVLSRRSYDMTDAERRFGETRDLWDGPLNLFDPMELFHDLSMALAQKYQDGDYLMKSGDILAFWAAMRIIELLGFTTARVLIFSTRDERYVERVVRFNDALDGFESSGVSQRMTIPPAEMLEEDAGNR